MYDDDTIAVPIGGAPHLFVNDFPSRVVDDHSARPHHLELSCPQEASRLGRQGAVQAHKVRAAQHGLKVFP